MGWGREDRGRERAESAAYECTLMAALLIKRVAKKVFSYQKCCGMTSRDLTANIDQNAKNV